MRRVAWRTTGPAGADRLGAVRGRRMVRFAEFFAGIGLVREAVAPLG